MARLNQKSCPSYYHKLILLVSVWDICSIVLDQSTPVIHNNHINNSHSNSNNTAGNNSTATGTGTGTGTGTDNHDNDDNNVYLYSLLGILSAITDVANC
jgi:hypothetical protein